VIIYHSRFLFAIFINLVILAVVLVDEVFIMIRSARQCLTRQYSVHLVSIRFRVAPSGEH
jgi:hypothetical protein